MALSWSFHVTQIIAVQTRISAEVWEIVRARCEAGGLSVSAWVRSLIHDVCDDPSWASEGQLRQGMARDLTFTVIALNGLLAVHPDETLRTRVHESYARKLEQRGLQKPLGTGEGQ